MATNAGKPNGQKYIAAEDVQSFLDPLPVEAIPMVGDKTADSLHLRGIKTIAQLREQPLSLLSAWYGKTGSFLYHKARGISHSRVGETRPLRSISREHTFETDRQNIAELSDYIFQLSERLVFDLLREEKTCGTLTIKIRYANFETFTRQCSFAPTDSLKEITATATRFFESIYDGKRKIRLIGVRLSQLQQDAAAPSLFHDYSREKKLTTAVNELKSKYGNRKIGLARSQDVLKKRKE
jgi:DNA polymerase-4